MIRYHVYVYCVLAIIRDSADLSKQCLAIGRMACFATVKHTMELLGHDSEVCFHYRHMSAIINYMKAN